MKLIQSLQGPILWDEYQRYEWHAGEWDVSYDVSWVD